MKPKYELIGFGSCTSDRGGEIHQWKRLELDARTRDEALVKGREAAVRFVFDEDDLDDFVIVEVVAEIDQAEDSFRDEIGQLRLARNKASNDAWIAEKRRRYEALKKEFEPNS